MFLSYKKLFLNNFFSKLYLKKKSLNIIKKYIYILNLLHYKFLPLNFFHFNKKLYLIKYIINISKKKSNIFFHITNCFGLKLLSYSIGLFKLNKKKLRKSEILQKFLKLIFLKIKILKNKSIVLHLFNINFNFNWFLEKIYIKFFVLSIKLYFNLSYNGCRKKKLKKK